MTDLTPLGACAKLKSVNMDMTDVENIEALAKVYTGERCNEWVCVAGKL